MIILSSYKKTLFLTRREVFINTKRPTTAPTAPPVRKIWFQWNDVLSFLPKNKVSYCDDLKPVLPDKFPWDYTYTFRQFNFTFTEILKAHPLPYQVEPPDVFTRFLFKLISLPWINIICDVDFIFGYEQVLFSTTKLDSQIFTFTDVRDMWPHKGAMYAYLKYKLRRNVLFIQAKTASVVKEYLKTRHHCEFLLMGQYFKEKQIAQDVKVLSELANPGGHILVWELTKHSTKVWEDSKKHQKVKEYFSCRFKGEEFKGFAVGHFVAQKNDHKPPQKKMQVIEQKNKKRVRNDGQNQRMPINSI